MRAKYNRLKTVPMPGKVAVTCRHCGAPFWLWPSDIKSMAGAHCSKACYDASRRRRQRVCAQCGDSFPVYNRAQRFCSGQCRGVARTATARARFWDRVDKTTECWLWMGSRDRQGYGQVMGRGAHRLAWELTYGPLPVGVHVLHDCDNPPCCRPEHLHLGDHPMNMAEASERARFPYDEDWRRAHANAVRLTPDDVRAIRRRYAAGGITQVALAREYGVGRTAIDSIIKRRSWRDID